ncbi:MAG TPA: hypothetical protein VG734_10530 [Lacunisphaera sp.]|nr:hypothetical protein [Lacunisphaera sp.]
MLGHLLHYLLTSDVQESDPIAIRFQCPACGEANAAGAVYDHTEQFKLLNFIPVGTSHSTWVTCYRCDLKSRATLPAEELARRAPGDINHFIRRRLPPALILLLIAGLLMSPFPPIGFVFPAIVLAWAGKYGGWVRRLAFIQIWLGVIMIITYIVIVLVAVANPKPKPTFPPRRQPVTAPAGAKP